jgi:SET domain-containing protein
MGTLYNHSYQPNAQFIRDYPRRLMNFVAVRPITPGEEITINYNYYPAI